ncbi:MAG: CsbD family protein [Pseudomonadota bacterium]
MNKDQIKGSAKEAAGKVQQKVGEVTGSTGQQIKGAAREIAGKAQKAYGDVKQEDRDQRNPR